MSVDRVITQEETLTIEDLQDEFLTLRVGEEIPRLQVLQVRKVTNRLKQNNLAGVDYKYLVETKDKRILTVSSWILWKQIISALRQAGKIEVDLELKHLSVGQYEVRVISPQI